MTTDWTKDVNKSLTNALHLSMNVMGRTGEEACKHGIIMMAKSAKEITPKARKRRLIQRDDKTLGEYVTVYNQGKGEPTRLYKWNMGKKKLANVAWPTAQRIWNAGMAKRSWSWGLGKVGGKSESRPLPGASRVYAITGEKVNGYVKQNRLPYITKILPAGWEMMVQTAATNKIFKQAALKMERIWQSRVKSGRASSPADIKAMFRIGIV